MIAAVVARYLASFAVTCAVVAVLLAVAAVTS